MRVLDRLFLALGYRPNNGAPLKRAFHLDEDLAQSVHYLAEREQRPPDEVAADLLIFALQHRSAAEENLRRWRSLSSREQQVAALVCRNYTNRQIAAHLFISPETVKTHVRNCVRKFGLHTRLELRQALEDWDFSAWNEENF